MTLTHLVPVIALLLILTGCQQADSASAPAKPPAKIEHPDEGDIYRLVLTPRAVERLQITTTPVARQSVTRHRVVGGDLQIPDGASVIVTAPLTGSLRVPADRELPLPGQSVTAGEPVFELLPLLSPEREVPTAAERVAIANATASLVSSQIIAEGDMKQAAAQVEAAEIALTRARQLFSDKVGSARDVDDAVARLDIANEALAAAGDRKQLLDKLTLEAQQGTLESVTVVAPRGGMLRSLTSSTGQLVNSGSPLFEVVGLETLWVRVPIYPGWREEIADASAVQIRPLGSPETGLTVRPVQAPPTADPLAATVDLYFELENTRQQFRPGERVEVVLPLRTETDALVIPRAAVLRDIHGVAWVYVRTDNTSFSRERVDVNFTTDDLAVLHRGPNPGTAVVVDGAAELFGTEFGAGK